MAEIIYHNTMQSVRDGFASLTTNGGYRVFVDAAGNFHYFAMNVTLPDGGRASTGVV